MRVDREPCRPRAAPGRLESSARCRELRAAPAPLLYTKAVKYSSSLYHSAFNFAQKTSRTFKNAHSHTDPQRHATLSSATLQHHLATLTHTHISRAFHVWQTPNPRALTRAGSPCTSHQFRSCSRALGVRLKARQQLLESSCGARA